MAYGARVLADSVSSLGIRLTTIEVTFPRIVLAEFNTHRVFSRNSASSRAIPVEKTLQRVQSDPFLPVYWGKNQKGMQADQEISRSEQLVAENEWLKALKSTIAYVQVLLQLGIHKQITNRLLEPWLYHTVIVTSTEWDNFKALRAHPDAQPEIRKAAVLLKDAMDVSTPVLLDDGMWHLPLVPDAPQLLSDGYSLDDLRLISVGRCARVSYLTHDGKRDPGADIDLALKLQKAGHMSPFEHVARPMTRDDVATIISQKSGITGFDVLDLDPREWFSGNFKGWHQFRKELPNEDNFMKTLAA